MSTLAQPNTELKLEEKQVPTTDELVDPGAFIEINITINCCAGSGIE